MHNQNSRRRRNPLLFHLPPLPEVIIEEILPKLPVKSLLRFRCVSRSWLSLIESDKFIKLHLETSTQNKNLAHHRLVFDVNGFYLSNGCSLQSFLDWMLGSSSSSSSFSPIIVDDPTYDPEPTSGYLTGCCNGVLCLASTVSSSEKSFCFWLWNPATRALIESPKLLGFNVRRQYGFGWDESSGAFKVFACSSSRSRSRSRSGHVYSSKTNSWKTVAKGSRSCFGAAGFYECGRLHWVIRDYSSDELRYDIESFDLEKDEFGRRIELPLFDANPNSNKGPDIVLGEIGGCLCTCLFDERVDVWVMKEYGAKDSWTKLLSFSLDASERTICRAFGLLEEGPNGEIFIMYGCTFFVYSPKDGDDDVHVPSRATNINLNNRYRAGIYVESLVSPTGLDY